MPSLFLLLIAVLLLPCLSGTALAEDFAELSQVRGVFIFGGFQHWLNLAYDFSDRKAGQSNSTNHILKESYNTALQMSLFDPNIFDSFLQGSVVFDQNRDRSETTSSANKTVSYQYNFNGNGLSKSRIPFTLLSFRTTDVIQNTYTPSTTTTNIGNEFGITFLNKRLQSRFQLARNSSDTTVSGTTSSSTYNTFSYAAEHEYGTFATTALTVAFSDQNGSTSNGENLTSTANSLSISNTLRFNAHSAYSLFSTFQLNNAVTDNLPTRYISYSENFTAVPGRALSFNAAYFLTNTRSSDRTGLVLENTINRGDVSLKHQLFESLHTELDGRVALNTLSDGTENNYSVRGSATYTKNLPAGARLSLGFSKAHELVDRQVISGTTTIRDELHARVHQGDTIVPAIGDGTLSSVTAVMSRNPLYTYTEGIDYTVNYALGSIRILSGGGVSIDMDGTGTDLYITYTVYKDPQIKYSSDSFALTSDLMLFDRQVTVGAAWSETKRTLISGPADNGLENSRLIMMYAGGGNDTYTGRLAYQNQLSGGLTTQFFEGNAAANWQTAASLISLVARDSYNLYDGTSISAAYRENSADFMFMYSRDLRANAKFTLQGNINDLRSQVRSTKDSLSLKATYLIIMNMVTLKMSGQSAWIIENNSTSRNDSFHVDVTRYF